MWEHLQKLVFAVYVLHRAQSSAKGRKPGMMESNIVQLHIVQLIWCPVAAQQAFFRPHVPTPPRPGCTQSHMGKALKDVHKLVRESECAESARILLFDLLQGGCRLPFVDVLWK